MLIADYGWPAGGLAIAAGGQSDRGAEALI